MSYLYGAYKNGLMSIINISDIDSWITAGFSIYRKVVAEGVEEDIAQANAAIEEMENEMYPTEGDIDETPLPDDEEEPILTEPESAVGTGSGETASIEPTTEEDALAAEGWTLVATPEGGYLVEDIDSEVVEAFSEPNGLFITKVPAENEGDIYYAHNKPLLEESNLIWRFMAESIAVSTDGGRTYPYEFRVTGEMIAKIIETIGLKAEWITSGQIGAQRINVTDLFAQDIVATGKITGMTLAGTKGEIGGFTIGEDSLSSENGQIILNAADGTYHLGTNSSYIGSDGSKITIKADEISLQGMPVITEAKVEKLMADQVTAFQASITNLTAKDVEIEAALIGKASVADLEAVQIRTRTLESDVAGIETLVNGNLTSANIHSLTLTASNTTIENGMIKSAMIDSLAADKITGLDINTTRLTVHSEDGKSIWTDNTIQIKDANRVRVQVGKDASGDYTLAVWDKTGKLIFDALGATEHTIQRKIIRDAMVADNAAIAGSKLDIPSVIREVNGAQTKISSTAINVDQKNQTLSAYLNTMETTIGDNLDAAKLYADGQMSAAQQYALNQANSALASAKTYAEGQANSAKSAAITAAATDATTKANNALNNAKSYADAAVDGLEIGGRNLLYKHIRAGGCCSKIDDLTVKIGTVTGDTYFYLKTHHRLIAGKTYTLSCDASNVPSGCDWTFGVRAQNSTNRLHINKNGRCHVVCTWDSDVAADAEFLLDDAVGRPATAPNIILSNFKLEAGNKATDWTPAPEDVDAKITNLTEITTTHSTSISTMQGQISVLITEDTNIKGDYNALVSRYNSTVSTVDALKNTIGEHTTLLDSQGKDIIAVNSKAATLENSLNGFGVSLSETRQTMTALTTRVQTAESKLTKDSLVTTIGSYYATQTALNTTNSNVATIQTIATQTSEKFNWIVKSGTSATNFTLTDRTATLVASAINLKGLVAFSGLDSTAQSKITTAQSTADTAKTNAATAQSTATTAKNNAATAQSTANAANSAATTANTTLNNWSYDSNKTYINGGKIYTKSIKAAQIDVADLFAQSITATGTITGATLKGGTISGATLTSDNGDTSVTTIKSGVITAASGSEKYCKIDGNIALSTSPTSSVKTLITGEGWITCEHLEALEIEVTNLTANIRRGTYWTTTKHYSGATGTSFRIINGTDTGANAAGTGVYLYGGGDSTGVYLASYPVYNRTTTTAANVCVNSSGVLCRHSSSSARYKNSIAYLTNKEEGNYASANSAYDYQEDMLALLKMPVAAYRYNEGYVNGELDYNSDTFQIAFIAEDVARICPACATYQSEAVYEINSDGEQVFVGERKTKIPEAWDEKQMIPRMLYIDQYQQKRLDGQEERIRELENRMAILTVELETLKMQRIVQMQGR